MQALENVPKFEKKHMFWKNYEPNLFCHFEGVRVYRIR